MMKSGVKQSTKRMLPCPLCGNELTVHGPEEWKPTFYDPDSGGDPYSAVCKCGFNFESGAYEYDEFLEKVNRRKSLNKVAEMAKVSAEREMRAAISRRNNNKDQSNGYCKAMQEVIDFIKSEVDTDEICKQKRICAF